MSEPLAAPAAGPPLTVVGILASPHGGGSTAAAVTAVLDACTTHGATSRLLDLTSTDPAAAVDAVEAADAVVFGSPTYRASHSSLLSSFLERLERGAKYEARAPLRATAASIVMTGAATEHFLATEGLRGVLASFFTAQVLSPSIFLTGAAFDKDKRPLAETAELLTLHAGALLELAQACRSSDYLKELGPLL